MLEGYLTGKSDIRCVLDVNMYHNTYFVYAIIV